MSASVLTDQPILSATRVLTIVVMNVCLWKGNFEVIREDADRLARFTETGPLHANRVDMG